MGVCISFCMRSRKIYISLPTLHFHLYPTKWFIGVYYLIVWMYHILFNQSLIDDHPDCHLEYFQSCIIRNSEYSRAYILLLFLFSRISLGQIPNSGLARVKRKHIGNFVRYCQILLHSGSIVLHSHLCFHSLINRICCQIVIFANLLGQNVISELFLTVNVL